MKHVVVLLLSAIFFATSLCRADTVDDFMEQTLKKNGVPGATLAVMRGGKIVKLRGYGFADLEHRVPASKSTVYPIGSITKTFTAVCVLLLVEDGTVSLDAPVANYLPDLPAAWKPVTVRQLLSHTSGVPSYTALPDFDTSTRLAASPTQVIASVADKPLDFPPGTKFAYSNTGFFLLGALLEKVSGKPYADVLRERITRPLGMTQTVPHDQRDVVPNLATGYAYNWENKTPRRADFMDYSWPGGAGVLRSNVADLLLWAQAWQKKKLLKPASWKAAWTQNTLTNGKSTTGYGLGFVLAPEAGHAAIGHNGGVSGYVCRMTYYPAENLTIIVLTNGEMNPDELSTGIAALYLPKPKP